MEKNAVAVAEKGRVAVGRDVVVRTDVHQFLKDLAGGRAVYDLAVELERVVAAVKETHHGGSVTLKVCIDPLKGSVDQLQVEGCVTSKVPKESVISVFFPTEDNTLSRKNPNQLDFEDKLE